jgi:hypothetical protein
MDISFSEAEDELATMREASEAEYRERLDKQTGR